MEENNMQIEKSNPQIDKVKITRFRFSIAQKVELLDLMKKGTPRTEICRTYNIPSSTLHQFLKDEARIRDEFEKNRDPNRQMIRQSPFHELEQALMQWIGAVQERNIPINGPIVQEKALEFAECMGLKDFSASGGWLDRFKKRENIDFKTPTKISNKPKVAKPLVPAPRPAVPNPPIQDFLPSDSDTAAPLPADVEFSPEPSLHGFEYPFSTSFPSAATARKPSDVRGLEQSLIDLELDHIRRMSTLLRHYKLLLVVEGEDDGLQAGGDFDLQCKLFGPEAGTNDAEPAIKSEISYGMYEEDMGDYFDGGAWSSSHFAAGHSAGSGAMYSLPAPMAGLKRKKSTTSNADPQKKRKHKAKKTLKVKLNPPTISLGKSSTGEPTREVGGAVPSTSVDVSHADNLIENGDGDGLKGKLQQDKDEELYLKKTKVDSGDFSRSSFTENGEEDERSHRDISRVRINPIDHPVSDGPLSYSNDSSNDGVADTSASSSNSHRKLGAKLNISSNILDDDDEEPP